MDISREKFNIDWKNLFPGVDLPNTNFSSESEIDREIIDLEHRIKRLRNQLTREEFLLSGLYKFKKEYSSQKNDETNKKILPKSLSEELYSQKFDINPDRNSIRVKKKPPPKSPVHMKSLNETEIMSFSTKPSVNNDLSTFSGGHKKTNSFGNSIDFDEKKLPEKPVPQRRLTDPGRNRPDIQQRPPPSTFPRKKKKTPVEPPVRKDSLDSTSVEFPPIDQELLDSLETSSPPSSIGSDSKNESGGQDNSDVSFDEAEINLPKDEKENNVFVTIQNEVNPANTDSFNIPDVNTRVFETINPIPNDVNGNTAANINAPKYPISSFSSEDEDEHIYTDINELNINRPKIQSVSEEEEEVRYENSHIQPKLERLAEVNDDDSDVKSSPKNEKKRLGSLDRQGSLFPDNLDITNSTGDDSLESEGIVFSNTSQDEPVIRQSNTPDIVVDKPSFEESSDDEEHIYANVEQFLKRKDSDDDSVCSDQDGLGDSVSLGAPSPIYREMTSQEIEKLQKKIESDDEPSTQSQEEYDSDDLTVPKTKLQRARGHSALAREPGLQPERTLIRNNTAPPSEKSSFMEESVEDERTEEEIKANRMRKYLVMNLLDSEKSYFDCLDMLAKFMKPLQASISSSQPVLSEADFKVIFHEASKLHEVHRAFLNKLEPRVENWTDSQLIGDLLTMIMDEFGVYYGYIGNYKQAMETVTKCRNANQRFKDILEQDIRIPSVKDPLKMEGLLYKPVDRLTQYSLILNDLLKYTSPDHPDHPLIVEVSGSLFDLFEQVNVDSSKKKRRQRQLLKETALVELVDGERRARSLILFNDVMISAKLKSSGDAYVLKWYASLCEINIKPYKNSEALQDVPVSSKVECDKLRAGIANTRAEIRKDHMPLQQVVSTEQNSFGKRGHLLGHARSSSRAVEKLKKKISEQESLLSLISPSIPLYIYHKSGKNYVLLLNAESEKQAWLEALKPRLKRIHARNPPPIQLSSLEIQQAFETVLKVQRLGRSISTASPFLGPTRPLSVDFSKFDEDKESLTGYLFVNIHNGKGFTRNSDTYVVLEMDSYGHFFKKAKTKPARGPDPVWEESFEFEIEACSILRLSCYNKLRLMGDDMTGKVAVNLVRENLLDNRNHFLGVSLDRSQGCMKISVCFSTSVDGIKKTRSISESGVFGVPISVVCRRERSDIPVIVISCIKEIERRGMEEVGIYRLSGMASEIKSLKQLFNEQTQNALLQLPETDIHAVAGLLKLYFRELPKSLFTSKLYNKFVQGLNITDPEEKELYMCETLNELPKNNLLTTLYLFEHLRRVSKYEQQNKMGVNNLATVFGPTVLRPSSTSDKENEQGSCNVGTFDIGALDVMSQVGVFRYFLSSKNERTHLPKDNLELWRRLDPRKAQKIEEELMEASDEFLI